MNLAALEQLQLELHGECSTDAGLSANIQLGPSFQLIPELNAIANSFGGPNGTNGTLALRWLATSSTNLEIYVSNAAGLFDIGQLLDNPNTRVGGRLVLSF